jgi:hypothetical protein
MEVPSIFTRTAGMPNVNWKMPDLQKWLFYISVKTSKRDPLIVSVGNEPFSPKRDANMPPTYREPDELEPRYTIEENGNYRYTTNPKDLEGISKQVWLSTARLGTFLRARYRSGELHEVSARPPRVRAKTEIKLPTIIFIKIVQRLSPSERDRDYADPLEKFLSEHGLGMVTGGGVLQDRNGKVVFAGIDVEVENVRRAIKPIARKLIELGAPKGSTLEYEVRGKLRRQRIHQL